MDVDYIIYLGRHTMETALLIAAPILIVCMASGIIVSLFQTVTQIRDMTLKFLVGKMLGFVLILTRIGAFFSSSPLFSWQAIPVRSKVTMALLISAFFAAITPCQFTSENMALIALSPIAFLPSCVFPGRSSHGKWG
jgi:flagellar biosynthetic protein FliQ